MPVAGPKKLFVALRDAPERRAALKADAGSTERYRLYGIDQLVSRGVEVRHNLERPGGSPLWARAADWAINRSLYGMGGYGGDFASVLTSLRLANAADGVLSTVDTVGLPLVLLKRAGLVRRPVVYTAIGLPERLVQLRGERMRGLYRAALRPGGTRSSRTPSTRRSGCASWLGPGGPPVVFLPFGVDVEAFQPDPDAYADDGRRVGRRGSAPRLRTAARGRVAPPGAELQDRRVGASAHALLPRSRRTSSSRSTSRSTRRATRLADARVVALPVRENSYSGATTVLLQAMALGKPVVVSRTAAIASGYELEDGVNCRLVEPGDVAALERAILETLTGADAGLALGTRARQTVERSFSWERYTDALWEVLSSVTRSPSG